jgi:hypothetical protein
MEPTRSKPNTREDSAACWNHRRTPRPGWAEIMDDVSSGLVFYYATSLVVGIGLLFGHDIVRGYPSVSSQPPRLIDTCLRFDGGIYLSIARDGYEYDPARCSNVAFFPAYPVLARSLTRFTGLRTESALVLVSNIFLAAAFIILAGYVRARGDNVPPAQVAWVLLAFGLYPTTFFFRMAYSESLFVACALLTLYGIAKKWPLVPLALVAGLTTATRPVGIAVTGAFLWHVLGGPGRLSTRTARVIVSLPIACWGLLAYMGYQWGAFGTPFAFAQTQQHWTFPITEAKEDWPDKLLSLLTIEPIRGVFDPGSPRFWCALESNDDPLFSLSFWNPCLFVFTGGLVAFGAWRRWLTGPEIVLAVGLLVIPYVTRACEMSMRSQGRFAAVVIGYYLVLGKLLAAAPTPLAAVLTCLGAVMLALWTAMYSAGYMFF